MAGLKTLIGNITQDPNGPMVKPNPSVVGIGAVMDEGKTESENPSASTEVQNEDPAATPESNHGENSVTNVPPSDFESDKADYDGHFHPAVFGDSDRKDSYVYDQVTRDVVAKNYMEKLAEENGMSVEDIERILNESTVENESNKEGTWSRFLGEIKPKNEAQADEIASILGKKVDRQSIRDNIRDKYNEYMQGYDEHVEYINSLDSAVIPMDKTQQRTMLVNQALNINDDYDTAIDEAHQEIDTYIEAREAISGLKDSMSPEAYAKLESGLIESNSVIAKSIGEYFPDCSEGKFANRDKESGLSGIDIDIPHEPIAIGPVEPENPINPSFPWNKQEPTPKPMPYRPWLDGGDVIITGEPDYINPDGTNPGQVIEYKDALYDGSSSLKNALGKVTDKVSEFGQKITSSLDNVVNNKTNRGHEFDDIVDKSSTDTQFDK